MLETYIEGLFHALCGSMGSDSEPTKLPQDESLGEKEGSLRQMNSCRKVLFQYTFQRKRFFFHCLLWVLSFYGSNHVLSSSYGCIFHNIYNISANVCILCFVHITYRQHHFSPLIVQRCNKQPKYRHEQIHTAGFVVL